MRYVSYANFKRTALVGHICCYNAVFKNYDFFLTENTRFAFALTWHSRVSNTAVNVSSRIGADLSTHFSKNAVENRMIT